MEFYDPELEQGTKATHQDAKTEKTVNDISDHVEKVYSNVESGAKSGWTAVNSFFGNLQQKMPEYTKNFDLKKQISETQKGLSDNLLKTRQKVGEALSSNLQALNLGDPSENINNFKQKSSKVLGDVGKNTQQYLSQLDTHLAGVKGVVAGQLGTFFPGKDAGNINGSTNTNYHIPKELDSSRVESQMHELQTNRQLYTDGLKDKKQSLDDFTLTREDEDEKRDLMKDKQSSIAKLYADLVPKDMDDTFFWKFYFNSKESIMKDERKRKELMEETAEDDDEEFNWDDSDDEAAKEESKDETQKDARKDKSADKSKDKESK